MKRKLKSNLFLLVLLFSFFNALGIQKLADKGALKRLNAAAVRSDGFRSQILDRRLLPLLGKETDRGKTVGLYLLESGFSYKKYRKPYTEEAFLELYRKWAVKEEWNPYVWACRAVWNDLVYFPVPESSRKKSLTVSFTDSWMHERTFGGSRGHEGTDIMAGKNRAGVYPVVSMTDGIVTEKGWLQKGGYRIGITAPSGGYFYYAHLDSYAELHVGDSVKAGDFLGYMGDSGYGSEGTKGQFPVHLHVGIYLEQGGKEISVNPYWILKYLENYKLKYAYS